MEILPGIMVDDRVEFEIVPWPEPFADELGSKLKDVFTGLGAHERDKFLTVLGDSAWTVIRTWDTPQATTWLFAVDTIMDNLAMHQQPYDMWPKQLLLLGLFINADTDDTGFLSGIATELEGNWFARNSKSAFTQQHAEEVAAGLLGLIRLRLILLLTLNATIRSVEQLQDHVDAVADIIGSEGSQRQTSRSSAKKARSVPASAADSACRAQQIIRRFSWQLTTEAWEQSQTKSFEVEGATEATIDPKAEHAIFTPLPQSSRVKKASMIAEEEFSTEWIRNAIVELGTILWGSSNQEKRDVRDLMSRLSSRGLM